MKQEVLEDQQCFWPKPTDDKCKVNNKEEPLMEREKMIALDKIRRDGDTQARMKLNKTVVKEFRDKCKLGKPFPPIIVFFDGTEHWIADGFHRWHAYEQAGKEEIPCEVRNGTLDDARRYAIEANQDNGLRRSNADKNRAVELAFKHKVYDKESSSFIAERLGVSHTFVAKVREKLEAAGLVESDSTRIGKDGKRQSAKKKKRKKGATTKKKKAVEPNSSEPQDVPCPECGELDWQEDENGRFCGTCRARTNTQSPAEDLSTGDSSQTAEHGDSDDPAQEDSETSSTHQTSDSTEDSTVADFEEGQRLLADAKSHYDMLNETCPSHYHAEMEELFASIIQKARTWGESV